MYATYHDGQLQQEQQHCPKKQKQGLEQGLHQRGEGREHTYKKDNAPHVEQDDA